VDEHGGIIWGIALKSAVQIELERNGAMYERRGLEISRQGRNPIDAVANLLNSGVA